MPPPRRRAPAGWLRPALFGATDGLVTNISLIAGVGAAGAAPHLIVLTGTAGLVAGSFSMALGEYVSVEAQRDALDSTSGGLSVPWVAAAASLLCFAVGALVPLLPYLLGFHSLVAGVGAGAVGLFAAGALTTRFTPRSWWAGGLRQVAFGVLAAVATFVVGALIGVTTH